MIKTKKYKKLSEQGFTLIELLVVTAIISLIASVVLVAVNNARKSSRDKKKVVEMRSLRSALSLYMDDKGYPPFANLNGVTSASSNEATPGNWQQLSQELKPYMQDLPTHNGSIYPFFYMVYGNGTGNVTLNNCSATNIKIFLPQGGYLLWAVLENPANNTTEGMKIYGPYFANYHMFYGGKAYELPCP
jgi:prepilin-type N-terminal cleavage/methylation domain-containing protein